MYKRAVAAVSQTAASQSITNLFSHHRQPTTKIFQQWRSRDLCRSHFKMNSKLCWSILLSLVFVGLAAAGPYALQQISGWRFLGEEVRGSYDIVYNHTVRLQYQCIELVTVHWYYHFVAHVQICAASYNARIINYQHMVVTNALHACACH